MPTKKSSGTSDTPGTKITRRHRPSSVDVAKLGGVSQAAVSRAFTEGASVSAKTKAKVLKAADELGYKPSILPRILVTDSSQLVAIVIGGMYNPYYAKVFELFAHRFQEDGYQILVFFVDHNEYFDDAIPLIMRYRVDGIISALSLLSPAAAEECARMQVPVVTFNGRRQKGAISSVCSDNTRGGQRIASLLHDEGGRHFAYVAGKRNSIANRQRRAGFVRMLKQLGVDRIDIAQGDFRFEGGYSAGHELFSRAPRPDAIFCANDLTAIGLIECARKEYGLDVPGDVKIAGFDNAVFSDWPSVELTTIDPAAERHCCRCIMCRTPSDSPVPPSPTRSTPCPARHRPSRSGAARRSQSRSEPS